MITHRHSLGLAFFLGLASNAVSQTNNSFQLIGESRWSNVQLGEAGPITRMVAGELNGDGQADAIVLTGGHVAMLDAVLVRGWISILPEGANDVDIAPGAAPTGNDAVAIVGPSGLRLWQRVASAVAGEADVFEPFGTVGGVWLGALKVRSANIDGVTGADYVGLAASGHKVIIHRGAEPQDVGIDSTSTVLDVFPLRWAPNAPWSIALLTTTGVEIRTQNGTVQAWYPNAGVPGDAFACVPGITRDRVVETHKDGGAQMLTVLKPGGVEGSQQLPFSNVVSLVCADQNRDRFSDLLVTRGDVWNPWFHLSQFPAEPTFNVGPPDDNGEDLDAQIGSAADPFVTVHTNLIPCASNTTQPLFADLDHDDRADLVSAVVQSTQHGPEATFPVFVGVDSCAECSNANVPLGATQEDGITSFTFETGTFPEMMLRITSNYDSFPTLANGIQVVIWKQAGFHGPIDSNAVKHYLYDASSLNITTDPQSFEFDVRIPDVLSTASSPPQPPYGICSQNIWWIEVHPAYFDVNYPNTIYDSYSARVIALASTTQSALLLNEAGEAVSGHMIGDDTVLLSCPSGAELLPPYPGPANSRILVSRRRVPANPGASGAPHVPTPQVVEGGIRHPEQ